MALMAQLRDRGHPDKPPAIATDGKCSYREAMVEAWGRVPEYTGQGRPPTQKQAGTLSFTTTHLSQFALFGEGKYHAYLPLVLRKSPGGRWRSVGSAEAALPPIAIPSVG
jgi:hypothetical protein